MSGENILVIAVDGLRAASLGAYGNTSFATPGFDQFAADSFLCDFAFADAVELPAIYRALWQSINPLNRDSHANNLALPRLLAERGYRTTLVTDEPALTGFEGAADFNDIVQLTVAAPERAADISQTALARIFTAACDEIHAGDTKRLIWLHVAGLYGPWDAPIELQEALLERDEGDPPPSDSLEPPNLFSDTSQDPDAAFRWSCAYAAQVMALDACLTALQDAITEVGCDRWLIVLFGVRGFPLGEHGRIGGVDRRLCVEQLHVPMLWRFPDGTGRLARDGQLTSHLDLVPTLLDSIAGIGDVELSSQPPFLGTSQLPRIRGSAAPARNELIAADSEGMLAIRTPDWTLRTGSAVDDSSASVQLYVRPDDRWEANDVAALCPDVVDKLTHHLVAASAGNAPDAETS